MHVKLYEFGISRSARAHWVLREAGVEYESISIDLTRGEQKAAEFLAVNPYGKLPVLVDTAGTVTESAAICTYIAEKYPEKKLVPVQGTISRAHYHQWICFCIAEMEPHLWSIRKNMLIYPKEKRSRQAIQIGKYEYNIVARILNDHLSSQEYILGQDFSAADIVICFDLIWADTLKLLKEYPVLTTYIERLKQRPAFPKFLFTESVLQGNLH
jgi:glutathione S-transferase